MSLENEALFRRWFDEVWNEKRADPIDALLAPDVVAYGLGPNGTAVNGPDEFKAVHAVFCGAFPDMKITVDPVVVNGDLVAGHFVCHATHTGNDLGIAPTGKPITVAGMSIARYKDGRIIESWNCLDLLPVFQQAGAVPLTTSLP